MAVFPHLHEEQRFSGHRVLVLSFALGCACAEDPCPADAPHLITVKLTGEPSYIGYRTRDQPWTAIQRSEFCVANEYAVAILCVDRAGSTRMAQYFGTAGEEARIVAPVCYTQSYEDSRVTVSGMVEQEAQIWVGEANAGRFGVTPWLFELSVPPGRHDLIATNTLTPSSGRIVIRRDLDISVATMVPPIDLSTGLPTREEQITVANMLPTETISTVVSWANDAALARGELAPTLTEAEGAVARVLSDAETSIRNHQIVTVYASSFPNARWTARRIATDTSIQSPFTLPIPLEGISYGGETTPVVQWGTLPDTYDAIESLVRLPPFVYGRLMYIRATRGWIDLTSSSSLAVETIPDISSAWVISAQEAHSTRFVVEIDSAGDEPKWVSIVNDRQ